MHRDSKSALFEARLWHPQCRYSLYLLYWYNMTNTDAGGGAQTWDCSSIPLFSSTASFWCDGLKKKLEKNLLSTLLVLEYLTSGTKISHLMVCRPSLRLAPTSLSGKDFVRSLLRRHAVPALLTHVFFFCTGFCSFFASAACSPRCTCSSCLSLSCSSYAPSAWEHI